MRIVPRFMFRPLKPVARIRYRLPIAPGGIRLAIAFVLLAFASQFFLAQWLYGLRFYHVPSRSMEPSIKPNDRIAVIKKDRYDRGDIVVINDPLNLGGHMVKRIVGVGGDEVEVRGGRLFVNGRAIHEPYLRFPMYYSMRAVRLNPDEVFVLGDNRNLSQDGHSWQCGLPVDSVTGKVAAIYYPFDHTRVVAHDVSVFAVASHPRLDMLAGAAP